ncbi:GPR1/FUN34/YaaH family transporter [Pseudonocardia hispaniensis]|uniref:GPR1/FUN34/YaaH family transporter n=1 Tax=Pseudonocardia hispaniensis TaxID=904933 RepID=A0ABW1J7H0_9PSEU
MTEADFGAGAEPVGPQEVQVGAGGDPLMIGIPVFVVGSLVLGMALIGVVPAAALPGIVPVILAATALFQTISTVWAALLGQGMVACIFALFAGFWASLAGLLLGLTHNWYGVAATQSASQIQLMFFIAWDVVFFFLALVMLRLPSVYPAILVLVLAAVTMVILGIEFPSAAQPLNVAAGACVLAFCGLGMWVFLHIGSVALGGPPRPALGPALLK